jgi:hypothetical protein
VIDCWTGDVAREFLIEIRQAREKTLTSDEHFTVDDRSVSQFEEFSLQR